MLASYTSMVVPIKLARETAVLNSVRSVSQFRMFVCAVTNPSQWEINTRGTFCNVNQENSVVEQRRIRRTAAATIKRFFQHHTSVTFCCLVRLQLLTLLTTPQAKLPQRPTRRRWTTVLAHRRLQTQISLTSLNVQQTIRQQ